MVNKPPGRGYHAAIVITVLVIALWVSVPFSYTESLLVVIFALAPLVLYWIVRLTVALIRDAAAVRHRLLGWLALPAIIGGLWLAVDVDLPFKARFALSQASMEGFAQDVLRSGAQDDCAWTGLFSVCGEIVGEDKSAPIGVELRIGDWFIAPSRCFVWAPHGQPRAEDYEYGLRHLTGPWWGCRGWGGW
ncbi:hypothetical protein [Streptosporangium saharense]|uniref:Uncharacterized protein n=1 Tax=Streptosporangium saharense TaxID=1706840 RepID=A0A7W7VKL8_9ACTN|nr:hypothetical protein [Streptosporangium saharense]MBB4913678.1 hypothetical protein [Streptosporangium saharense]